MFLITLYLFNDVCYYAKIRILKQITTDSVLKSARKRCLLLCKDKNFKANHNTVRSDDFLTVDVCYYAKIRILKQITTQSDMIKAFLLMFVTMQR